MTDLREKTETAFSLENQALVEYVRGLDGVHPDKLEAWDVGYYAERMRKDALSFDKDALRP